MTLDILYSAVRHPAAIRPRIVSLEDSLIAEVSKLGFGQKDVLPLWYGEGDLPTPAFICEAAAKALAGGETFYTWCEGIPPLRQAIAGYAPSSGMQGIFLTVQAIVAPGDNVLVVSPVWPNIRGAVEIFSAEPRDVALGRTDDGGSRLDLAALEARLDSRTRAVFVNSPSNPTGWMMTEAESRDLLDFTRRHGLWLGGGQVYSRVASGRAARH